MLDAGRFKSRQRGMNDKSRGVLQICAWGAGAWVLGMSAGLLFEEWLLTVGCMILGTLIFLQARLLWSALQDGPSDRTELPAERETFADGGSDDLFAYHET